MLRTGYFYTPWVKSSIEFHQMLENVKSKWCEVESIQHEKPFVARRASWPSDEGKCDRTCELAGLASPLQNVAWFCYRMVKGDTGSKMELTLLSNRNEIKTVHQMGEYHLELAI